MTKEEIKAMAKKIYPQVVEQLKEEVKQTTGWDIPPLVFTRSKKKFGHIRVMANTEEPIEIAISPSVFETYSKDLPRLYRQTGFTKLEDKLLNTICHEIAHITHWKHTPEHKELTRRYQQEVQVNIDTKIQPLRIAADIVGNKLTDISNNPQKARAALRKAGYTKPGNGWEWAEVPTDIIELLNSKGLLK